MVYTKTIFHLNVREKWWIFTNSLVYNGGGRGQGLSPPLPLWCPPLCAFSIAKYCMMLQIFFVFSRLCSKAGQIPLAALSKCAGSWQFCHLQSISCRVLCIGLHSEPSSRQGGLGVCCLLLLLCCLLLQNILTGLL